jgi:hypothetical protein
MPWDYRAATGSELHPVQKFILVAIQYKIIFHHSYADYYVYFIYKSVCEIETFTKFIVYGISKSYSPKFHCLLQTCTAMKLLSALINNKSMMACSLIFLLHI